MPETRNTPSEPGRRRGTILALVTAVIACGFGLGSALQTATLRSMGGQIGDVWADFGLRVLVNVVSVAVVVALAEAIRLVRFSRGPLVAAALGVAVCGSAVRVALQWLMHIEIAPTVFDAMIEFFSAVVTVLLALGFGWLMAELIARAEREVVRSAGQGRRAAAALEALRAEELRVRREVAEGLHGTVQQRLVLLQARLREIERLLGSGQPREETVQQLQEVRAELDRLREVDVRGLSRMLTPEGLELGLVQAIRIMVRRLPATIAVELVVGPKLNELDRLFEVSLERRLLAVRCVEEGLTNALRHGHASRLRLCLDLVDDRAVRVSVEDDGGGMPEGAALNGLRQLDERLAAFGGWLRMGPGENLGGALVEAEIPGTPLRQVTSQATR